MCFNCKKELHKTVTTNFSTTIQKQINLNLITPTEMSFLFFLLQMGTHVQQMSYSFKVPVYKFVTLSINLLLGPD